MCVSFGITILCGRCNMTNRIEYEVARSHWTAVVFHSNLPMITSFALLASFCRIVYLDFILILLITGSFVYSVFLLYLILYFCSS